MTYEINQSQFDYFNNYLHLYKPKAIFDCCLFNKKMYGNTPHYNCFQYFFKNKSEYENLIKDTKNFINEIDDELYQYYVLFLMSNPLKSTFIKWDLKHNPELINNKNCKLKIGYLLTPKN